MFPCFKIKLIAKMLKAIRAQKSKKVAEKRQTVVGDLCSIKMKEASTKMENDTEKTLASYEFPSEY
ncbi:hypothetical protein DW094_07270 [Ruminococcaceae bacterium AM07-15]|nr:hypothetical protein DW094_07270 [Ruminococcaceae bacterium AM07-15]